MKPSLIPPHLLEGGHYQKSQKQFLEGFIRGNIYVRFTFFGVPLPKNVISTHQGIMNPVGVNDLPDRDSTSSVETLPLNLISIYWKNCPRSGITRIAISTAALPKRISAAKTKSANGKIYVLFKKNRLFLLITLTF